MRSRNGLLVTGAVVLVAAALSLVVNLVSDTISVNHRWGRLVVWILVVLLLGAAIAIEHFRRIADQPAPAPEAAAQALPAAAIALAPAVGIARTPLTDLHRRAEVTALAWSNDGRRFACGGSDKRIVVYDARVGAVVAEWDAGGSPIEIVFSPDGTHLAAANLLNPTIRAWNVASAECILVATHPRWGSLIGTHWVHGLTFQPDGHILAAGNFDQTIRFLDFPAGTVRAETPEKGNVIKAVAYSPEGELVASGGNDGLLRVRDAASHTLLHALSGHHDWINHLAWTPDGKRIVTAGRDRTVRVWDVNRAALEASLGGHTDGISGLVVQPDGEHAVTSGGDGTLRLWSLSGGHLMQTQAVDGSALRALAVDPTTGRLLVGGKNGRLTVWEVGG